MTKATATKEPELLLTPGPDKAGRNPAKPKVKERPGPPPPSNPPSGGTSGKPTPAKKHEMVVHQAQLPAQPKTLLQVIAEAAANPTVDVQKMKELLAIQQQMEQREAETDFNDALSRAKAKMPAVVGPDRKNDHTKSNYATLEKVSRTMDKIIAAEGFTISYGMAESSLADHYRITTRLSRGKFSRDYFIDLPADTKGAKGGETKTLVQGIGSTISYGRRYLKLMMFDLVVGREDDDGQGGRDVATISESQAETILNLCSEKNIGLQLFQQAFRVQAVEDLPAIRYDDVIARLKAAPKAAPKKEMAADHE